MRALFLVSLPLLVVTACPAPPDDGGEGEGEGEDNLVEAEPNDGDPVTDVNDLPVGRAIAGSVDGDDVDFFHLTEQTATHIYRARLSANGLGAAKLVVLDDGRGGDAPGADYVRIVNGDAVEFAVLGGGSVYIAVDDEGEGGGYILVVEDISGDFIRDAIDTDVEDSVDGALDHAGAVAVYALPPTVSRGVDVVFDLEADGDLDARLFVVSRSVGDWIARNDDRAVDDLDPLIDAPLTDDGPYFVLVENSALAPTSLSFTLTSR